jgi:hypothetical protein
MSELSKLSPKGSNGHNPDQNRHWGGKIEEFLGLWSEYGSGTYGAIASMFLDELVKEGDVVSQRDPDGKTWLYRAGDISN